MTTSPRPVVLHIGTGKTGTSSVQVRLHRNRERLARLGVLYPLSLGQRRHVRLGLSLQPDEGHRRGPEWRHLDQDTPGDLRAAVEEELVAEIDAAAPRLVLLSDEALYGAAAESLHRLRDLMDRIASSVRVLVYLRRQDDHLCSRYQQLVKRVGEVRRLADRVEEVDVTRLYDYHSRLVEWRSTMRPEELVVRLFERSRFPDGSLHEDFFAAAGLGVSPDDLDGVPRRNDSLDAETVELLRLLNLLTGGTPGATADLIGRTRGFRRLQRGSDGPTLTLPADRLDRFMAQWADSNRAVARDFVPDAPDTLFTDPRKDRGSTTEQYLEPSRVGHFADLLDLPGDVRRELLAIAEREARGG